MSNPFDGRKHMVGASLHSQETEIKAGEALLRRRKEEVAQRKQAAEVVRTGRIRSRQLTDDCQAGWLPLLEELFRYAKAHHGEAHLPDSVTFVLMGGTSLTLEAHSQLCFYSCKVNGKRRRTMEYYSVFGRTNIVTFKKGLVERIRAVPTPPRNSYADTYYLRVLSQ